MVKPLDIYLGQELSAERKTAIEAVAATGLDDNEFEFWDRVQRVQDICGRWDVSPAIVAQAIDFIWPYVSPDGEYGHMIVADCDLNGLLAAIARANGQDG